MLEKPRISIILLAGGLGGRMQSPLPKQFLLLDDKPIALHSFDLFASLRNCYELIVVCDPHYRDLFSPPQEIPLRFADPGLRRQDSVYHGLQFCSPDTDFVCVHDSARPLLEKEDLLRLFEAAFAHGAAVLGVPVKATIKSSDENHFVKETLNRNELWEIQTPQIAKPSLFHRGFALANQKGIDVTDDVSLVELLNHPVKIVKGSYENIKITTPEDLEIAKRFLEHAKV
jgi:2-C-methyl-D-erythritol 4-phosphate cytidylyltransferase